MSDESKTPQERLEELRREIADSGSVNNSAVATPWLIQKLAESAILISQIAENSTQKIIALTRKLLIYTICLSVLTLCLLLLELRGLLAGFGHK
jgi:hypothetical protein